VIIFVLGLCCIVCSKDPGGLKQELK